MVKTCCIEGCDSTNKSGEKLTYYKFPKNKRHKTKWVKVIQSSEKITSKSLVCSSHFLDADYRQDASGRRTLRSTSVPSIFITRDPTMDASIKDSTDKSNLFDMGVDGLTDFEDSISKKVFIKDCFIGGEHKNADSNDGNKSVHNDDIDEKSNDNTSSSLIYTNAVNDVGEITSGVENNEVSKESNDPISNDLDKDKAVEEKEKAIITTGDGNSSNCSIEPQEESACNGELEDKPDDKSDTPAEPKNNPETLEEPCTPDSLTDIVHDTDELRKKCDTNGKENESTESKDIELSDNKKDIEKGVDENKDKETSLDKIGQENDVNNQKTIPESKETSSKEKDVEKVECTPSEPLESDENSQISGENAKEAPNSSNLMESNVETVECTPELFMESDGGTHDGDSELEESVVMCDFDTLAEPMFVEVNRNNDNGSSSSPPDSPTDCVMIVENVQVDVDPSTLLNDDDEPPADDDDDMDVQVLENKPPEPVSLLTSSDESDVIIEEPEVDLVEVSDETDEDDMPLTRLIRARKLAAANYPPSELEKKLKDIFWGTVSEFYCYCCSFTTHSKTALAEHVKKHAAVGPNSRQRTILTCPICNYQSASKAQFSRHKRKHREEKRFQCHICDYKARHKMSLVYHLKSHNESEKQQYKCKKCSYKTTEQNLMHQHLKTSHKGKNKVQMFKCPHCKYSTKRSSDLARHVSRHKRTEGDGGKYWPGRKV